MDAEWWHGVGVWEIKIKGGGLVLIKYERYWCGWCDIPNIPRPSPQIKENLNIEGSICNWQKVDISTDYNCAAPRPTSPSGRPSSSCCPTATPEPAAGRARTGPRYNCNYCIALWWSTVKPYKESPRGAASGLSRCNFFILQTSLLSLFLVQMG